MIASILLSLLLPAFVAAHGYVNKVTIDGKDYQGNSVGTTPTSASVIRQVNTNSPIKGATNADLGCGAGAQPAADIASANPGSTVLVSWVGGTTGSSPWPHNTGPIMHYMAQCQGSCSSFDSSSAKWFKISEQGLESDGRTWYQSQFQSGTPATVTIPNTLAPGNYLLRSELIALQLAMTQGGAEFYPSCIQLSVGGSQTGQPSSSELVSFPGAYSDTDPGILTPNIYNPPITYTFPGPPVAAFVSGGSSNGTSGDSVSPSQAPGASAPSSVPSVTSSGAGMSPSSAPSVPVNLGGNPSLPAPSATPSPTSGGSGSTCTAGRKRSSLPKRSVDSKRMHRRRNRTSH